MCRPISKELLKAESDRALYKISSKLRFKCGRCSENKLGVKGEFEAKYWHEEWQLICKECRFELTIKNNED
jgi:hypothetical protein